MKFKISEAITTNSRGETVFHAEDYPVGQILSTKGKTTFKRYWVVNECPTKKGKLRKVIVNPSNSSTLRADAASHFCSEVCNFSGEYKVQLAKCTVNPDNSLHIEDSTTQKLEIKNGIIVGIPQGCVAYNILDDNNPRSRLDQLQVHEDDFVRIDLNQVKSAKIKARWYHTEPISIDELAKGKYGNIVRFIKYSGKSADVTLAWREPGHNQVNFSAIQIPLDAIIGKVTNDNYPCIITWLDLDYAERTKLDNVLVHSGQLSDSYLNQFKLRQSGIKHFNMEKCSIISNEVSISDSTAFTNSNISTGFPVAVQNTLNISSSEIQLDDE